MKQFLPFYKKISSFAFLVYLITSSPYLHAILPLPIKERITEREAQYALLRVVPGALLVAEGTIHVARGIRGTTDTRKTRLKRLLNAAQAACGTAFIFVGLNSLDIIRVTVNGGLHIAQGNNLIALLSLLTHLQDPIFRT